MKKVRGFEVVREDMQKFPGVATILPVRKTQQAMACDFYSKEDYTIQPGEAHHFATDVKAYMQPSECLIINVRSSIGFKKGLRLVNTQGWIDADYYENPDNDGNIGICLKNDTNVPVTIEKDERIAQGAFLSYLVPDGDEDVEKETRTGGIGSTGTK